MSSISLIDWIITLALIGVAWRFLTSVEHPDRSATFDQPAVALPSGLVSPPATTRPFEDELDRVLCAAGAIDRDQFLGGARLAYERIVSSFAIGDLAAVRLLLSESVHAAFLSAIAERQERGETLSTIFIGFVSADPVEAGIDQSTAWISVRFVAQLVSFLTDRQSRILRGSRTDVIEITENWTFEHGIGSQDPNWILVATDGGA